MCNCPFVFQPAHCMGLGKCMREEDTSGSIFKISNYECNTVSLQTFSNQKRIEKF